MNDEKSPLSGFGSEPSLPYYRIQFLTPSGWETKLDCDSESVAKAHFSAIGKANIWSGHVRIMHGDRVVESTEINRRS